MTLGKLHFLPARDNGTNRVTELAESIDVRLNEFRVLPGADYNHSHSHVKGSIHLCFSNLSDLLQKTKDRQDGPTAFADFHRRPLRQDARDVVRESTASNVSETFHYTRIEQSVQCLKVT